MTVDRELLFKSRVPEADVDLELEGIGRETFRVRGLSRAEAMEIQKLGDDVAAVERRMLALGIVGPLRFTEGQVREWQEACPAGELDPLSDKIAALSGMTVGAAKAAYKEFDADPAAEFRALPGSEIEHDGGETAGRNDGG